MSRKLFKTHPHLKGCNKWARQTAQYFLAVYPQWDTYLAIETYNEENYLVIKVPAPINPTEHDLIISTYDGKLTVHFDLYHAHFYRDERTTDHEVLDQAKNFINQILDDQVIVCIRMEKGNFRSFMWITSDMLTTYILSDWTGYTRSWLGTHTKIYQESSV